MSYPPYPERFATADVPRELDFPEAEYARRLARTRAAMEVAGIDLLLVSSLANVCWLTGFQTPSSGTFACLFVPAAGPPVLQVIDHEYGCARYTSWIEDIRTFAWYRPEDGVALHGKILEELAGGRAGMRVGVESHHPIAPERLSAMIGGSGVRAERVAAEGLVNQVRRVKSEAELAAMRHSGAIAVAATEATLAEVRSGTTDSEIAARLHERMIREGAEFVNMGPFVATGVRSSLIHTTWKRRPVERGDLIFVETACPFRRYNAPVMRSAVVGPATPLVERLAAAVDATLAALLGGIRAGRTGHDIAVEATAAFRPVLDEIYFQGAFGYTVGLGLPPNWAEGSTPFIAEGIEDELVAGMTLHLPVAARVVGVGGVALSETVLVEEGGCSSLTGSSRAFLVIDDG